MEHFWGDSDGRLNNLELLFHPSLITESAQAPDVSISARKWK